MPTQSSRTSTVALQLAAGVQRDDRRERRGLLWRDPGRAGRAYGLSAHTPDQSWENQSSDSRASTRSTSARMPSRR